MTWNRTEALSIGFLRRAFLTPPVISKTKARLEGTGCPGGICVIEAGAAEFYRKRPIG